MGTFTDAAKSLATELEVYVVDGDNLIDTVHAADLYPKVAELISVDASVTQAIHLETMAERIVTNTDAESLQAVYDALYAFFAGHPTVPQIEENMTLEAFWDLNPNGNSQ